MYGILKNEHQEITAKDSKKILIRYQYARQKYLVEENRKKGRGKRGRKRNEKEKKRKSEDRKRKKHPSNLITQSLNSSTFGFDSQTRKKVKETFLIRLKRLLLSMCSSSLFLWLNFLLCVNCLSFFPLFQRFIKSNLTDQLHYQSIQFSTVSIFHELIEKLIN